MKMKIMDADIGSEPAPTLALAAGRKAGGKADPLEDRCTEMLATVLAHQPQFARAFLTSVVKDESLESIADVRTQVPVSHPENDLRVDLQLIAERDDGTSVAVWIEVKTFSGEHGDQLRRMQDVFADHCEGMATSIEPFEKLILLAPSRLHESTLLDGLSVPGGHERGRDGGDGPEPSAVHRATWEDVDRALRATAFGDTGGAASRDCWDLRSQEWSYEQREALELCTYLRSRYVALFLSALSDHSLNEFASEVRPREPREVIEFLDAARSHAVSAIGHRWEQGVGVAEGGERWWNAHLAEPSHDGFVIECSFARRAFWNGEGGGPAYAVGLTYFPGAHDAQRSIIDAVARKLDLKQGGLSKRIERWYRTLPLAPLVEASTDVDDQFELVSGVLRSELDAIVRAVNESNS